MEITHLKGEIVHLKGEHLNILDDAPEAKLIDANLNEVVVGGKKNKIQLFVVVPSLDTGVCAAETRRFNEEVSKLDIVETYVISMDLPFAAKRFCVAEGIDNLTVASDYCDKEFVQKYGVEMADGKLRGLAARSIFVVNEDGKIAYKEIVNEVTSEPDYGRILEAIKDAKIY